MKKLAIIFPGVGYTCTKPLLYYTASMAAERGYESSALTTARTSTPSTAAPQQNWNLS